MDLLLAAILLAQDEEDLKRVHEILEQAEQTAAAIKEPYLRSKAWSRVVEARAESKDVDGVLRLLQGIPDAYEKSLGYASAARVLAKSGDEAAARRVVMLGLNATENGEKDFKTGNAVGHLVIALAEAGDLDGAVKRLEGVPGGPTGQDFAVKDVAFVLAKKGRVQKALELLGKAEDRTFIRGIEDMVKVADPASALPIVNRIRDRYDRGRILGTIAREQQARGNTDDAIATAKSIEDRVARCETMVHLADALRPKHPDLADGMLAHARSAAEGIDEPGHRCDSFAALARAWGRAFKPEAAARHAELSEKAFRDIPEELRRWRLSRVAAAVCAGGNLTRALELAKSDAKAPYGDVLTEIARSQVEVGDFKGALRTIETCKEQFPRAQVLFEISVREPDPAEARRRLRESFAAMKDVDTSSKSLNDYRNGKPEWEFLDKVLEASAGRGEFETSVQIGLRLLKDMGQYLGSFALRQVALEQAQAGQLKEALAWIAGIEDPLPKSLALVGAAEGEYRRAKR